MKQYHHCLDCTPLYLIHLIISDFCLIESNINNPQQVCSQPKTPWTQCRCRLSTPSLTSAEWHACWLVSNYCHKQAMESVPLSRKLKLTEALWRARGGGEEREVGRWGGEKKRHTEFRRQSPAAVPLAHRPRGQEQGNAQLGTENQALSAAPPSPAIPLPPPPLRSFSFT